MKFKNDNIKIAKNILDKYKILSKSSQQKRGKYVGAMVGNENIFKSCYVSLRRHRLAT